jgi:hypothetical protein
MVGDAGDAAQGVVRVVPGGIHLADDGVFGPVDGGERGHRGADTVTSVVVSHRLERPGWVGQPQFRCVGEQFDHIVESTVVDP